MVAGVSLHLRKMGLVVKPNLVVSIDDGGVITMRSESTFKTIEVKFKLDEEFDETTADGRKTKVDSLSLCSLSLPLTPFFKKNNKIKKIA